MKTLTRHLLFLLLMFAPARAAAQSVTNPTKVEYTVSADHATLTKYTIGYFLPGATDPVQTADLAIVAPTAGVVVQAINATPLGYGTYIAKMQSVAGAVAGEWSAASNEFSRAPLPPPAPLVKK